MENEEFGKLPEVEAPEGTSAPAAPAAPAPEPAPMPEQAPAPAPVEEAEDDVEIDTIKETENMELLKEGDEFVLDLTARGITINLEQDELDELKQLLA